MIAGAAAAAIALAALATGVWSGFPGHRGAAPPECTTPPPFEGRGGARTTRAARSGSALSARAGNPVPVAAGRVATRAPSRPSAGTRRASVGVGLDELEVALYSAAPPSVAPGEGVRSEGRPGIELWTRSEGAGGSSVRIAGRDPSAPRALWLWRVEPGGAALLARGSSRTDGSLAFPHVVVPPSGLALVATPAGARPGGGERSPLVRVAGRSLGAPVAAIAVGAAGERILRVAPRETAGEIVLADASGRELGRLAVDGARAARGFEIDLDEFPGAEPAKVAHVLPGGGRSDWRSVEPWVHAHGPR